MELEDVGKTITWGEPRTYHNLIHSKVIMGIKAPRGKCFLFGQNYISPDTQCDGIRAFMEQHREAQG